MAILFGFIGVLMMLAICVGIIFFAVFMARKVGLLKSTDGQVDATASRQFSDIKRFSHSMAFRVVVVLLLIGIMTIPLGMVGNIVTERSGLYQSVQRDIAQTWGHRQRLKAAVLLVPYTEKYETVEVLTDKDGNESKKNKTVIKQRTAIVLPDELIIKVNLHGQTRERSIYESLVYSADLSITGNFERPDITSLSNHIDEVHWGRAWFAIGISDTQAINNVSALDLGGQFAPIDFEPGTKITQTIDSGFHAPLNLNSNVSETIPFALTININGSQGFYFSPFGKTTDVIIESDWPHPSFAGSVLPDQHEVTSNGFSANWSVPNLARNYPQLWVLETQAFDIDEFSAGVNLFEPVSLYSQITRAIKYGILFVVLTYVTFLLFEMGIQRRLHIIQYGVIGLALSLFYLTLLSMAEHAGFIKAYVSAATLIIAMISLYVLSAIRSMARAGIIALLLTALYALLYAMLRLEDYALAAGTCLLLVVLAVMMVLTRNVGEGGSTVALQNDQ